MENLSKSACMHNVCVWQVFYRTALYVNILRFHNKKDNITRLRMVWLSFIWEVTVPREYQTANRNIKTGILKQSAETIVAKIMWQSVDSSSDWSVESIEYNWLSYIYHSVSFPIPSPISLKQVKASLTVENFADRHGSLYFIQYCILQNLRVLRETSP